MKVPTLLKGCTLKSEYGKSVIAETYTLNDGKLIEWLSFGSEAKPVVVFPVTDSGEVVYLRHYRYGAKETVNELPGGQIEKKEDSPVVTAQRELREEAKYEVDGENIREISNKPVWFDPASFRCTYRACPATKCRKIEDAKDYRDDGEICKRMLCSLKEWYAMVSDGSVRDSKSIAVSLLVLSHLDKAQRKTALSGLLS